MIGKFIRQMEEKMEYATGHGGWIGNAYGVGYRFNGPKPELRASEPERRFALNKINLNTTAEEWTPTRLRRF